MSLAVPYESVQDASMRLQQTVVLYDGEPCYITRVAERGPGDNAKDIFRVHAIPLPVDVASMGRGELRDEEFRKYISSKKFDLAPFSLGFMNYKKRAVYLSRLPKRQQKQGLSNGTMGCDFVCNDPNSPAMRIQMTGLIGEQAFVDCIKGVYPTMEEATRMIQEKDVSSVAFSRTYALVKDRSLNELVYLYHKKDKVGFITENKLTLAKAAQCLKESLREVGIRC